MRDLLWRVCFRRKIRPHQVTGDTTYGTAENIVALEDAGIRAYVPAARLRRTATAVLRPGRLHLRRRARRVPLPAGPSAAARRSQAHRGSRRLPRRRRDLQRLPGQGQVHRPATTAASSSARFYDDYLEKVRGYHATEAYQKAMRKRQVWVEPLFAEAKEWHGLRRFRLRGLLNANIQGLLIAAGQNLKRFLAATGWGRRHAPCGSLLALPREPGRLSAVYG